MRILADIVQSPTRHKEVPTEDSNLLADPAEQQLRLLRSVPAFAGLPPRALQELAGKVSEEAYPLGAVVVTEGEPADRLFLIAEGEVEVSMAGPEGRVPLSRMSEGELFGEIGLLTPLRQRTARVTVTRPLLLVSLSRRHFQELVERHPEARAALVAAAEQALVASLLKRASPFEKLSAETTRWLSSRLEVREFPAGATVFGQGDPADVCYLVRAGQVEVVKEEAAGERRVATLSTGAIVGEAALLTDAPRNASLRTLESASLLALRRSDLLQVLDVEKKIGPQVVELMRQRDRPVQAEAIVAHPRPTPEGGTIWVLEDPKRFGLYHQLSPLGFFVWRHLDGRHNVEETAAEYRKQHGPVEPREIAELAAGLIASGFARTKELRPDVAQAIAERSWWDRVLGWIKGREP